MFEKLVVNYAPRMAAWILIVLGLCLLFTCLTGCQTSQQMAKNLKGKSIAGNGVISIQKIVLTEPETGTYTPEISSMVINGDFQSILKDANFLRYDRKESASVFNASCKTVSESLTINLSGDKADMPGTVEKVKDYVKAQADIAAKKKEAETAETTETEKASSDTSGAVVK